MFGPTVRTLPFPIRQLKIFLDLSAHVTPLRGRKESPHLLQFPPNLFGLVFESIDRLTDPSIVRRFPRKLHPSLQAQVFDTHDCESFRHLARELMQKVTPQIRDAFVRSRNL